MCTPYKNSKYVDAYRHYLEEAKQENAQSTDFHLMSIPWTTATIACLQQKYQMTTTDST